MIVPAPDDDVLRAAVAVIARHGWHELTLERVAAEAGVSRVTLYRRGVTKELLVETLSARAAEGWRAGIWPALTGPGSAAERLDKALRAACAAVEAQLPLLAGMGGLPDAILLRAEAPSRAEGPPASPPASPPADPAPGPSPQSPGPPAAPGPVPSPAGRAGARGRLREVYLAPFERLLRDGAADGSLAPQADPAAAAAALFGMVPRTYLDLRAGQGWPAGQAADVLVGLVLGGLLPRGGGG